MNKRIILHFLTIFFFLFNVGISFAEPSLLERYPGPWKNDFNAGISRALAKNKIRGCGEFKYRASSEDKNEYIVRCTKDGTNWSTYIVWVGIDKVMGPYKPDTSLDEKINK